MKVEDTAPRPGVRTPRRPVAGAIVRSVIRIIVSVNLHNEFIVKNY